MPQPILLNEGLPISGATMGCKVYVGLTTGNGKGSNAASVNPDGGVPPPP